MRLVFGRSSSSVVTRKWGLSGRTASGRLTAVGFVLAVLAATAAGEPQVVLQERIESSGTVVATSRGSVEILDVQGQRAAYRIQPPDDPGISLSGTSAMIRFPAEVRITGQLGLTVLKPGRQVRFSARVYVAQGTWRLTDGDAPCGPDGQEQGGRGRLVGVLMSDFELFDPFDLGERGSFVAPRDGDLYLRCQNDWNRIAESSGAVTVHFRETPQP